MYKQFEIRSGGIGFLFPYVLVFLMGGVLACPVRAGASEAHGLSGEAAALRLERAEERLRKLEELLGRSASGLEATEAPDVEPPKHELLARLARLEERLASMEVVAADSLPASAEDAGASIVPRQKTAEEQPGKLTVSDARATFLPSRGTAGGPLHYGGLGRRLSFHTFLDLEYTDSGPDGARSGVSTFDNHHANLFVRSEIRSDLIGHIEIEYEHSGDIVEIDQAFVAWAATDWLTLRGGRFYTPFGIERFVWYSPTNAMVSRPAVMRQIVPGNFYANGIELSGVLGSRLGRRFTYEVAVSDGLGDEAVFDRRGSRQSRDNNSSRALSGRLGFALSPHLEIGSSVHRQRYSTDADLDLTFFGLDLAGRWNGWELRTEWVDATVEDQAFDDPAHTLDLEQDGWYAQLAYTFLWDRDFLPELRLVTRYDEVDLDRAVSGNDDQRLWAIGVNLSLVEHFRTKLEYQFASEGGPALDDDTFRFQLVLDY